MTSPLDAKIAFLRAAHDFAVTPNALNFRTLKTAALLHQSVVYLYPPLKRHLNAFEVPGEIR